jgi:biopolymer transport protein ExbB/TolQ
MTNVIWLLIIAGGLAVLLIVATMKKWISWKGGHGIATLTAFHDFQPKDKQNAIEILMEQKAGKKLEEQETGQDKEGNPQSSTSLSTRRAVGKIKSHAGNSVRER